MSKEKVIFVGIVDDHELARMGLESLLKDDPEIVVAFTAENGLDLERMLNKVKEVSVLIIDLNMPVRDGLESFQWLRSNGIDTPILITSAQITPAIISQLKGEPNIGLITKSDCTRITLPVAIKKLLYTGFYLSENLKKMIADLSSTHKWIEELSDSEKDVLRLMALGYDSKGIAKELKYKENTIISKRKMIYRKMGTNIQAEVVRMAIGAGIIEL